MAQKLNKVKGGDLMLFVSGKALAFATSHTLSITAETQDTSNKDEGGGKWAAEEVKMLSWTASSNNFYCVSDTAGKADDNSTYAELYDAMVAGTPIDAIFAAKNEAVNDVSDVAETSKAWTPKAPKFTGKAIITKLELQAPNGEFATYSVELSGVGELKKVTE